MGRHRKPTRVRTGLLTACATLAVGAVTLGTGLVPSAVEHFSSDGASEGIRTGSAVTPQGLGEPSPTLNRERPAAEAPRDTDTDTEAGTDADADRRLASTTRRPADDAPKAPEPEAGRSAAGQQQQSPETTKPERKASASPASPDVTEAPPHTDTRPDRDIDHDTDREPAASADPAPAAVGEVLALVNQERTQVGCRPLEADPSLAALATAYSRDMAERGYFSHTDPEGRDPWDRAAAAGVTYLGGENIALGQPDARAVMSAWMNSQGHRDNILNCGFTTIGVGVHMADGGPWWTQSLGYSY